MTRQQVLNIASGYENQASNARIAGNEEYAKWLDSQASAVYLYIVENNLLYEA